MNADKSKLISDLIALREDYDRVCEKLNEKEAILENLQIKYDEMVQEKAGTNVTKLRKEGIYNVEKILNHKLVHSELVFLIRWEHFGPESDTWEPKRNLYCVGILNDYMKKKQLK